MWRRQRRLRDDRFLNFSHRPSTYRSQQTPQVPPPRETHAMDANDPKLTRMAATAREYCDLIENMDTTDCRACLTTMARLLPRIGAAAEQLDAVPAEAVHTGTPNYDARFGLFSRIKSALGSLDTYHLEYDQPDDQLDLSGSLADDFTDIYFDLHYGLALLQEDPMQPELATASWRTSYELHWSEHLTGARHQLDALLKRLS